MKKKKEVALSPISLESKTIKQLEKEISRALREELYLPLLMLLSPDEKLENAKSSHLEAAIKSGRIVHHHGKFTGRFNAKISLELKRLGAKWNKKYKSFDLTLAKMPASISSAVIASENRFIRTLEKLKRSLKGITSAKIADSLNIEKIFDTQIFQVDKKIESQIKKLTVMPDMSKGKKKLIADQYTTNMKKYIKEWTEKEIVSLRKEVEKNFNKGIRYEQMVDKISKKYEVSKSKAKFLARQESHLLMAQVKKSRYQDAGIDTYMWRTVVGSANHPVRPMHKSLDGKKFSWDNPPITDDNGNRNNPGEDYNCRCTAVPLVRY